MNHGQRMIASLLVIACVLLAMNVIVGPSWASQSGRTEALQEPTVVSGSVIQAAGGNAWRITRFWSDGAVDTGALQFPTTCEPVVICEQTPVVPASACATSDVDHDGQIGTVDLLALLAAWGPCVPPLE